MIVVDTTVLVHAVGADHPMREPSRRLVEAIAAGRIDATTTVEVIQEFVHVRSRRQGRRDAAKAGRNFAELLAPLLVARDLIVDDALQIFERHKSLGAFDAFLAASAIAGKADALLSADRAFSSVGSLVHIEPGTPAFERLLAA